MGTDIHLFVEKKVNGNWINVLPPKPSEVANGILFEEIKVLSDGWQWVSEPKELPEWKVDRHYFLFSILANVRNDGTCDYISNAKGLPVDMSPELKAHMEEFLEHTPTWLTVEEILQFNWSKGIFTRLGVRRYDELCDYFVKGIIPFIQSYCKASPEHIRLVMYFDS